MGLESILDFLNLDELGDPFGGFDFGEGLPMVSDFSSFSDPLLEAQQFEGLLSPEDFAILEAQQFQGLPETTIGTKFGGSPITVGEPSSGPILPQGPSALSRILDAVGRGAEGALRASGQRDGGRGGGFFFSAPPHPDVISPLAPVPPIEAPTPIPFPSAPPASSPEQGLGQLGPPDFFPETRSRLPSRLSLQDLLGR